MFLRIIDSYGLPKPKTEFQFHATRKWRFDYAWPEHKLALEIEGGVFGYTKKDGTKSGVGAHSSVTGILRDIDKYNAAASDGWRILRVLPKELISTKTFDLIKKALNH